MTDFGALLAALGECQVEYIVVGGAAAIAHGVAVRTRQKAPPLASGYIARMGERAVHYIWFGAA